MNKFIIAFVTVFITLFLLPSCTETEGKQTESQTCRICFQLKRDIELLPFPATKGIPGYTPSDPRSVEEQDVSLFFSTIEYVVYEKESGAIVKHRTLTEHNSDDFGNYVYDELEAGTYFIALLAHSASGISLTGNQASGAEVSDSFHAIKEVVVSRASEGSPVDIILKRVVARVEFTGLKKAPSNASGFIIQIMEQHNIIDIKTSNASGSRLLKKEYPLAGNGEPADDPLYAFYTYVPEPLSGDTSYLGNIRLITLDINEDTLHTIDLTAIPVMKNRITRYSGSLYAPNTNSNALELEIEDYGQWKDTINVSF